MPKTGVVAGQALRDRALDLFEDRDLLETLRAQPRAIARKQGTVSANDLRPLLPADLSRNGRNIMGSVFRGRSWQAAGWTQTDEPAGHARWIQVWRLREDA